MGRFFINLHRRGGSVNGAMTGNALADDVATLLVGNDVVELQAHPLQMCGARVDNHGVIVIKGPVVIDIHFYDRVNVAAGFDLFVGVGRIPHQGGPAVFKIPQVVGVIHHLGTIRIGVEGAQFAAVPDRLAGFISDIIGVRFVRFRHKGFGLHFRLL